MATLIRAILAGLFGVTAALAQLTVSPASWKGMEIAFESKIEPSGTLLPGGVVVLSGKVHHGITDNAHKREFGYDIALDPSPDGKTARIRIERSEAKGHDEAGWTLLVLPKYPVIPDVKIGDTVALDLLINPATGQKIVDYLTLRRHGDLDLRPQPRDFQLTDVELSLLGPKIFVDGKPAGQLAAGGVSGSVVWLYVVGHGRFVASLMPYEKLGFRKNGLVSENGLLFHDGMAEIRVECESRIAPTSGAFNLYLVHETEWRPERLGGVTVGSADRPEFVIGKK